VSNSSLFYERGFLLVEGASEENALPSMYQGLFGRSMREDGIVIMSMETGSGWRSMLKVFLRYRAERTVMLLDTDCQLPGSGANISVANLRALQFPEDWIQRNCFYVGIKEFEDSFASRDIAEVLNLYWPKEAAGTWEAEEIEALKQQATKFSEELIAHVIPRCVPQCRSSLKKPEVAGRIGRHCATVEKVPERIQACFRRVREASGIVN
jgi:hypothetical protein